MTPHRGDRILVQGDRRPILSIADGKAITEDEAGFRYVFDIEGLAWDEATRCWFVVPLSMLRCSTCGVLLDGVAQDCGFCGEVVA